MRVKNGSQAVVGRDFPIIRVPKLLKFKEMSTNRAET